MQAESLSRTPMTTSTRVQSCTALHSSRPRCTLHHIDVGRARASHQGTKKERKEKEKKRIGHDWVRCLGREVLPVRRQADRVLQPLGAHPMGLLPGLPHLMGLQPLGLQPMGVHPMEV